VVLLELEDLQEEPLVEQQEVQQEGPLVAQLEELLEELLEVRQEEPLEAQQVEALAQ
jgi:hypothetical protein